MKKVVIIRYSEIFLKGKNFYFFEDKLFANIKEKLDGIKCFINRLNKRFFVSDYDVIDEKRIVSNLLTVFGIHSISTGVMTSSDDAAIKEYVSTIKLSAKTFRVSVNRADKSFPYTSIEYSGMLGGIVLKNNKGIKVDLHNPEIDLNVDIRDNDVTFIYHDTISALGGMPVGTSGSGMLLLSGGIDSPVAGYMMAKRGMPLSAIHFHSYPYTSIQAKEKVIELGRIISKYTGHFKLYIVSFTKIQEEIHKNCDGDYMITIMRRIMFRIAERLCKEKGIESIITGENLGQVASQTVESMTVTTDVVNELPIFRPLISFDKSEITDISKKIGAYETSILPYEDCCTVFLPKHPVIRPRVPKCEKEESKLDLETLITGAMQNIEIVNI